MFYNKARTRKIEYEMEILTRMIQNVEKGVRYLEDEMEDLSKRLLAVEELRLAVSHALQEIKELRDGK